VAAVAFELLSLWICALCETAVPLPERVLKIAFRNNSQEHCHVSLDVRNVSKCFSLQGIFYFGKSQESQGAQSGE
jgi:hypothetical protein